MYALAIGVSSSSTLEFGFCIVQSIVFALVFGNYSSVESSQADTLQAMGTTIDILLNMKASFDKAMQAWTWAKFAILGMIGVTFLIHVISRYNRHVIYKLPFFEFAKKEIKP